MDYPYQITSFEQYKNAYQQSKEHPEQFWSEIAAHFDWKKKWHTVLDWNFKDPSVKWFDGGLINVSENCLDRHLESFGDKTAILWEPNDPNESNRNITYRELHDKVNKFALALRQQGVQKGDRICIYMGMIPELVIAMLACARIGAIHSIIFGGFSAKSISDRVQDAAATMIITCDKAYRGNKTVDLKAIVDEALPHCPTVETVIVHQRSSSSFQATNPQDISWQALEATVQETFIEPEYVDAEHPLFILYTSGSTDKPKGVVHGSAGYLIWANYTFVNVFQYQPSQLFFCTADIGWITGHSYIVYGPLSAGASVLLFEGTPTYPSPARFWEIIDKHQVDIHYTAPTAIRSLMAFGNEIVDAHDLSSLKVIGSVGEPINEEAWHWYHDHVGKSSIPLVDTWWQTETGGILISNLAGVTPQIPTFATLPLPGVFPVLVDDKGNIIEAANVTGNLCIEFPWPGMIRTTYGDHERCKQTYFSTYPNLYFTGDGSFRDENGNYRITGRVDDVLNVSGHRIGTAELENVINMHDDIIESAIVGYPHDIKGQGIYAFVFSNHPIAEQNKVRSEIMDIITKEIGPIAKPDKIQFVPGLPRTRSGKIMRRILRKIAENDLSNLGDTSTLVDPSIVTSIIAERIE